MKVGQTLLLYKDKDKEFVRHKITKIGRKYIYCKTDDKYEHEIRLNKTTIFVLKYRSRHSQKYGN